MPDWPELKERIRVRRGSLEDRVLKQIDDWWQRRQERRQTAPAQVPAPVPQPVAKADLTAMPPEELQAEKKKIMAEVLVNPRFAEYSSNASLSRGPRRLRPRVQGLRLSLQRYPEGTGSAVSVETSRRARDHSKPVPRKASRRTGVVARMGERMDTSDARKPRKSLMF